MSEKKGRKKGVGVKDYESYSVNPSSSKNRIQGLSIGAQLERQRITDILTDEVISDKITKGDKVLVKDKATFIKLFGEAQIDIVKLNSSGIAVLSYIFSCLGKCMDDVHIDNEEFGSFYNSIEGFEGKDSKMVCYRGILNLLLHKLIYRRVGEGHYFINVNKFFNGDRTKVDWVTEINKRLDAGENVKQSEVKYRP